MRRCVIVGAAEIKEYEAVKKALREDDFLIFCDGGLKHCSGLGAVPDLIIGDFDSYEKPETEVETIVLPRAKDDTDTFYAAKTAVARGFKEFLLLGAVGGRLDHTLGNLSILLMLESMDVKAKLIDDYGEMEIVSKEPAYIDDSFIYFSLMNICGVAREITVENAKFPLEKGEITCDYQYGISNEVLPGKTAKVSVGEGNLLLIKIRQE